MADSKALDPSEPLLQMLEKYSLNTLQDHTNAMKEIVQEIALCGLWRAKFFEKGAFYGGTALRILYKLDRFSEDLDFTLLKSDPAFDISVYQKAIAEELESFGFVAKVEKKKKTQKSAVDSAFIKMNTLEHLLFIGLPAGLNRGVHRDEVIKIKLEVDTDPPKGCGETENKVLLLPYPFAIKTLRLEDLFAGKAHAALCRQWKGREKGRDWYDLIWFISRKVKLSLKYLEERMRQSGHWNKKSSLTPSELKAIFVNRIDQLDIESAKRDIANFISDSKVLELWSKPFFKEVCNRINTL